jgi:hypothetical protein
MNWGTHGRSESVPTVATELRRRKAEGMEGALSGSWQSVAERRAEAVSEQKAYH